MNAPFLVVSRIPLLTSGGLTRESATGTIVILVDETLSRQETAVTVWHELVHLIKSAGHSSQKEEDVESIAQQLALDFPQILEWVGIEMADAMLEARKERGEG